MKVANSPLFIEDVPENNNEIRRGSTAKRRLVVKNLGDKRAEIDIWIAAADNKSDPLLRWCTFSEKNPLSIDARDSKEVTLNFQIPQQATLDLYNYEILVEAAAQYPGKIFRRPQQLRVLSSDQDAEFVNEPAFSIQPVTSSANPLPLQAGAQLQVKVRVENRSRRVDRFYLNCPELTKEWYTVRYPESSLDIPGLVKETDGLELNPGSTGEITLILHPPQYTPSRNYFPTIRLTSNNTEDLVLQDVVYLQILPDDSLNVEMRPLSRKIPQEAGGFDLELSNQGNIKREITISAKDEEGLFTYILQPSVVQISAGEKQKVALTVKPKQPWRRPWWGKGLTSTFNIELEDTLLPNTSKPLALPKNLPQGTLVWQSRPWWLLWLLILLGLATMGGVGFAIWLKFFNSQVPEVMKFEATQDREGKGDDISLHWEISKPSQVKKVTIIRQEGNVETDRKNFLFPDELKNRNVNCESSLPGITSGDIQDVLKCTVLSQTPQKAGNYTFKIEVYSQQNQQQPSSSQITDTITVKPIKPLPLPQITEFSSTQPTYKEVSATPSLGDRSIPGLIGLNWNISNFSQIQELRIVGLAPDNSINSELKRYRIINHRLPVELINLCTLTTNNLSCKNVPTDARKAGDYTFKLTVIPTEEQGTQEITKDTAKIKILPQPTKPATPVKILAFKINNQQVDQNPKFIFPINKQRSNPTITMSWQVQDGEDIKVELTPFGDVEKPQGSRKYTLTQPPSHEIFTLKVTNKAGEKIEKSVVIDTVDSTPPSQPQLSSPGRTSRQTAPTNNSPSTASPTPSTANNSAPTTPPRPPLNSSKLLPIELPPKPN